jgi:hypothetical protein
MTSVIPACAAESPFWDRLEPRWDDDNSLLACYSKQLKADLLPGMFVLLTPEMTNRSRDNVHDGMVAWWHGGMVARIVGLGTTSRSGALSSQTSVQVNIFKRFTDFSATEGFLCPKVLDDNHLRHLPEIVQTTELRVVSCDDIMNLAFVFTKSSLHDLCNTFFACQGMTIAFIIRFRYKRVSDLPILIGVPSGYCLPFPSSYKNSRYHDCFSSRIWNSVMCIKLEMTKLLGRYSHQQGLYGKEVCRLSNFTAETWGFLRWQFDNVFDDAGCGISTRIRRHRVTESGLVVRAARVIKCCTVLRSETNHLQRLCNVFGESASAGQRCRLPKISSPKGLWQNDIINVVCGSDAQEPGLNVKTVRDGVDLEFDGCSKLFITIRYRRFTYTASNLVDVECDPLLSALIRRCDLYAGIDESEEVEDHAVIVNGSEFEDYDGCLYRVVSVDTTRVHSRCCYPQSNSVKFGLEKSFDIQLAKELIELRLNG